MKTHAFTPGAFRELNAKAIELLNQYPPLTFEEIAAILGITRQRVQQVNVKLGKYGRVSKHEQIKQRETLEKQRVEDILKRVEEAKGTLWPRWSAAGRRVEEPATFPTRAQAPAEYNAYANAKQRCSNPKNPKYKDYGGRGILFKFNNFEEFWKHIGPIPWPGLELDRIENNGHYEFGNVRWTTHKSQCRIGGRRVGGQRQRKEVKS